MVAFVTWSHYSAKHIMVRVNVSDNLQRPLLDYQSNSKISLKCLPSSSPIRNSHQRLLVFDQATKKSTVERDRISLQVNSSFSSSPIKKISHSVHARKKNNNLGKSEIDPCDFKCTQSDYFEPENELRSNLLLKSVNFIQKKSYTVDESVSSFLNRFNQDGVLDLGLDEVSYGAENNSTFNSNISPTSHKSALKYHISYFSNKLETIIEIPSSEDIDIDALKIQLVNSLRKALVLSQTGSRKYKVVILTPRPGASWFERKLQAYPLQFRNDFQYIIVTGKKSFAPKLKSCLKSFS